MRILRVDFRHFGLNLKKISIYISIMLHFFELEVSKRAIVRNGNSVIIRT